MVAESIKQLNSQPSSGVMYWYILQCPITVHKCLKLSHFQTHILWILKPLIYLTVLQRTKQLCSKPLTWINDLIILLELLKIYIICKFEGNLQQWLQYSKFTHYCFQEPISCFISSKSLKHVVLLYELSVLISPKNKIHTDLSLRNKTVLLCSALLSSTLISITS